MTTVNLNIQSIELLAALAKKRNAVEETEALTNGNLVTALIAEAYRTEVNNNLRIVYISDDEYEASVKKKHDADLATEQASAHASNLRNIEIEREELALKEDQKSAKHAEDLRMIELKSAVS